MTITAKFTSEKTRRKIPRVGSYTASTRKTDLFDSNIWDSKKEKMEGAMASVPEVTALTIEIKAKDERELLQKLNRWISTLEKLKN